MVDDNASTRADSMTLREANIDKLETAVFDVLVIGGGINGAVSAAALAARGAKVALIDARDFAGFTSQHSSNLVWGGIKYMEGFEFGLVADLCKSRNELMRSFPSTVREIRFLTTVSKKFRHHPLLLWLGAWVYWVFGRGHTQVPAFLSARRIETEEPVVNTADSRGGIEYSDAYLHDNDARFVFNFVRSALDKGCVAANYVESRGASRNRDGEWVTQATDVISGRSINVRSRILVNAAGPFVDAHNELTGVATEHRHILSKGVHLLVPRITDNRRVLAFFADDGRLFFAIPMANRTCIGTTDNRVSSADTAVTEDDRDYVLSNINARLNLPSPLTRADIVAERCGVRPLAVRGGDESPSDFLQLSRKHVLEVSESCPHISIFGGKLTDCVNVGEEVCEQVEALGVSLCKSQEPWYGEPGPEARQAYERRAQALGLDTLRAVDTNESLMRRLWRRYGVHAEEILEVVAADATSVESAIGTTGLRRCELVYLAKNEMIVKLQDLLRRRSKIDLLIPTRELLESPGMLETCEVLFGDEARVRLDEFRDNSD